MDWIDGGLVLRGRLLIVSMKKHFFFCKSMGVAFDSRGLLVSGSWISVSVRQMSVHC